MNKKVLKLCTAAFAIFMMLHSASILLAQVAELEIIGRKNTYFLLSVEGLQQNSEPVNRIEVKNLHPGNNNIIIHFKDTLLKPVETGIALQPNTRAVYRLVKNSSPPGETPSFNPFRRIGALFSDEGRGNSYYSLKLLETTAIQIHYEEIQNDTVSVAIDTITDTRRSPTYHFTRENPNVSVRPDTSATATTDRDTTAITETLDTISEYNDQKKTLLTENQHKRIISSVSSLSFEEDRIKYLNRELKDVSLSSKQLSEILKQFDFERSKLQVSKQYYHQLADRENASELYQSFEFNTTIEELKRWIYEQSR